MCIVTVITAINSEKGWWYFVNGGIFIKDVKVEEQMISNFTNPVKVILLGKKT